MGRERPSRHGAILGKALAALVEAGREIEPNIPPACATCAFREGTMPNQMAATGIVALKCVTGADPDDFACHYGMAEGWPTKLCAGYHAAIRAPAEVRIRIVEKVAADVAEIDDSDDPIREAFELWHADIDPDGLMDDYQLARAFARLSAHPHDIKGEREGL